MNLGWRIWGRWFKCNLSNPPPFIEKIAGGSIPINQGGCDYHVKLHFHLRPPLLHFQFVGLPQTLIEPL
jgi:hypothetical protein